MFSRQDGLRVLRAYLYATLESVTRGGGSVWEKGEKIGAVAGHRVMGDVAG